MRKSVIITVLALVLAALPAYAQQQNARIVSSCGAPNLTATQMTHITVDTDGRLCVSPISVTGTVAIDQTEGNNVVVLGAGSNIAGVVGIDQSTPGLTNKVTITDSFGNAITGVTDQCYGVAKLKFSARLTSSTKAKIITKDAAKLNIICDILVLNAGATMERFHVIEGTQTTTQCDTGPTEIGLGSTTVAEALPLSASGGGFGRSVTYEGNAINKDTCVGIAGTNETLVSGHYIQIVP